MGQLVRVGAPVHKAVAEHPHLPLDRAVCILAERLTRELERFDQTITEQTATLHIELESAGVHTARTVLA